MPVEYTGGIVRNTKVFRTQEEQLDIEHTGVGGTGKSANKLDGGIAGPAKGASVKAQVDTTGVGINQTDSLKRVSASWS